MQDLEERYFARVHDAQSRYNDVVNSARNEHDEEVQAAREELHAGASGRFDVLFGKQPEPPTEIARALIEGMIDDAIAKRVEALRLPKPDEDDPANDDHSVAQFTDKEPVS